MGEIPLALTFSGINAVREQPHNVFVRALHVSPALLRRKLRWNYMRFQCRNAGDTRVMRRLIHSQIRRVAAP